MLRQKIKQGDRMDEDEGRVELGWLGLVDEVFHYSPIVGVEDSFWKLKAKTRLSVLEGWAEAIQTLIEGNDSFGEHEDNTQKPEELSSAVIINFPADNV